MKSLRARRPSRHVSFCVVILSGAPFAQRRISPRLLPLHADHCSLTTDHLLLRSTI